jgi:hypothetical protein
MSRLPGPRWSVFADHPWSIITDHPSRPAAARRLLCTRIQGPSCDSACPPRAASPLRLMTAWTNETFAGRSEMGARHASRRRVTRPPADGRETVLSVRKIALGSPMTSGRRFVDNLPRDVIADEAELTKIASESPAAPPRAKPPSGSNEQQPSATRVAEPGACRRQKQQQRQAPRVLGAPPSLSHRPIFSAIAWTLVGTYRGGRSRGPFHDTDGAPSPLPKACPAARP